MNSSLNKVIIVLAGNYREFCEFARSHPDKNRLVLGNDAHKMRGLDAEKIEEIGTFWRLHDSRELRMIAEAQIR